MMLAGLQFKLWSASTHVQPTRPKSRSYGTLRDGSVAKHVPGISCGIEIGRRTYATAAHLLLEEQEINSQLITPSRRPNRDSLIKVWSPELTSDPDCLFVAHQESADEKAAPGAPSRFLPSSESEMPESKASPTKPERSAPEC